MVTQCNTDVPEARMQPVDHLVDKGSYQRDAYLFYWILFWNDKGKFSILTPSPSLKMFFGFPGTLEVINGMEEVPICDSQAQRLMKYSGIWKKQFELSCGNYRVVYGRDLKWGMRLDKGAVVLNSDVIRKQDHLRMNLDQTISLGLQIFLDHRSSSTTFNFRM